MLYRGTFSDVNSNIYKVEIRTGSSTELYPITLASTSPVLIEGSSEGLFSAIKSRSCSINILCTEYIPDLYEPSSRGTRVRISTGGVDVVGDTLFYGYLTPVQYDQTYSNTMDVITLEAVDAISTSKDYKFSNDGTYKSMLQLFYNILSTTGYTGWFYAPETYSKVNNYNIMVSNDTFSILNYLSVSSANFIEDNEEQTPLSEYEVLEECLKYLGFSLVPSGDDVYLVDYKALVSNNVINYRKYKLNPNSPTISENTVVQAQIISLNPIQINLSNEAAGVPNISIDDIYNKIEISDNLYPIEDLVPDVLDNNNHISVTDEIQRLSGISGVNVSQWTNTETKTFLWWETDRKTTITGYDYQTLCKMNPSTGWKHFYYDTQASPRNRKDYELDDYYNPAVSAKSIYTNGIINKYVNTHCCLIQHYAHRKNEGKNNLPSSIDWSDVLTFFINNDTTPNFSIYDVDGFELPVLEYTTPESINFTPATGTSWLTIKGDLYYQYNGAKEDKKKLSIITGVGSSVSSDKLMYTTAPVDKSVDISAMNYINLYRKSSSDEYGTGYRMWKFKLKVGDKYWNGEEWTKIESTFYINYNNNPDGSNDEVVPAFAWASTVNNKNFKDKVGVDGYCIPITPADSVSGKLTLTIYTPSLISPDVIDLFRQFNGTISGSIPWSLLPPVIYAKDFEFGYVYTDSSVWYNAHDDEDKSDKVYIGNIDDNYVKDFDRIEFKVNTALSEKPISRSFVLRSENPDPTREWENLEMKEYVSTIRHINRDSAKTQEYNIIDNYLDHHSERKVIYECNLHNYYSPISIFDYSQYLDIDSALVVDTQSYDVANDNNRIKLIQF